MKNDKILVHQNYMDEFKSDLDEEIKVIHNKPFIDKYNMMQSNLYSSENYLTIQNKEINYDKIISSECLEIDNFSNQSPDIHLNLKIGDDSEDKQVFQSLFDPNWELHQSEESLEDQHQSDSLSEGSIDNEKDFNFRPNGYLLRKINFMSD